MGLDVSSMAFAPPSPTYNEKEPYPVVWLKTKKSWKIPAYHLKGGDKRRPRKVIIYSHGNAADIGMTLGILEFLHSMLKVDVLCYEYPGFGLASNLDPTEEGVYDCIDAAVKYVIGKEGGFVKLQDILFYGRSVGSGPAVDAVTRQGYCDCGGLILESGLMSLLEVYRDLGLTSGAEVSDENQFFWKYFAPKNMFDNRTKFRDLKCPVLMMHGELDDIIPVNHVVGLWKAVPESCPKFRELVPEAGHNDVRIKIGDKKFVKLLKDFIYQKYEQEDEEEEEIKEEQEDEEKLDYEKDKEEEKAQNYSPNEKTKKKIQVETEEEEIKIVENTVDENSGKVDKTEMVPGEQKEEKSKEPNNTTEKEDEQPEDKDAKSTSFFGRMKFW